MIALTLPYPPTVNKLYRSNGGRWYLTRFGVEYKKNVAEIVAGQGCKTLSGRVAVFVAAYMPDKRKRDIMNLEKILSDSLTAAGVWLDDSQIDDFHIVRKEIVAGGQVKIVVTEL